MEPALRCHLCGAHELSLAHWQPGIRIAAAHVDERFDVATRLCAVCGLVQTLPQPPPELLARFYAGQHRDLFVDDGGAGRTPGEGSRRDQLHWLRHSLGGLFGLRVLEIGCYDGYLLSLLEAEGAVGTGVEPSHAAAEFAREHRGLDVRTGLLEEVSLPESRFDLIVMSHVLEHVRDPRATLERCHKLLRDGGMLFVEVPNVLRPRVESAVDFFTFDHLFHFSPATLSRLARRAGFERLRCDEEFPFPAFRWLGRASVPDDDTRDAAATVRDAREAVDRYDVDRQAFVQRLKDRVARDIERWRGDGKRIAVYGAGAHTEALFAHTALREAELVAVVDGNPAKQGSVFAGLRVVAPDALPSLAADVVVVSSFDFQAEMVETVQRLCSASPPELVTFYESPRAFSNFAGRSNEEPR